MQHRTRPELIITCVGTGDAFNSGGRLHSCFHLAGDDTCLLLDCGSSSPAGFARCAINSEQIDAVIVSHLHGDHFGGIPYLLLAGKYLQQRRRPLTLIGPTQLRPRVETLTEALYPGMLADGLGFPVTYATLNPQRPLQLGRAEVSCWPLAHGSSAAAFGVRVTLAERILAYSGDTQWSENLLPLSRNADLFICECCAYDEPLPGHLDYLTLLQQRERLDCRRLVLTHPGPALLARKEQLQLELLEDGRRLRF
ncbi:MAG: MBL fold metallo-hydrolase [Pelovirga sp.]